VIPVSTLAERIRWILDNRPYSAQALSTRAGLAPGHVGHFLHDRVKNPRRDTLAAIAMAAGVSVWWLVDGTGDPNDPGSPSVDLSNQPLTDRPIVSATPAVVQFEGEPGEMPETLGQRRDYDKQERSARKQLAQEGAPVDEWVWPHVAATNNFTLANSPPSVAMLIALAKVIQAHGDPSVKPKK